MSTLEQNAWYDLKNAISNFLGNNTDDGYKNIVRKCCNMSVKIYLLKPDIDFFQKN